MFGLNTVGDSDYEIRMKIWFGQSFRMTIGGILMIGSILVVEKKQVYQQIQKFRTAVVVEKLRL